MKKKALLVLMAAVLCTFVLGMMSVSAYTSGIYTYDVSDGKATITDCDTSATGALVIPETLGEGGYTVTSIGSYAFEDCTGLTSVEIPDSVTSIGDWAFSGCTELTKVDITDMEAWCGIEFSNGTSNPLYYANNLYLNGNLVTNLEIPSGVTSIGDYAFSYCTGLTSVEIPDSVTSIGDYAFYNCTGLTSVEIPDSVTTIGSYAFFSCKGLTSVEIPNSVTTIGDSAFEECTGLANVTIPDSVTSIGDFAFYGCTGLTSVKIPDSVTSIGKSAFSGCTGLTSVEIPNSVTSIDSYAFSNCTGLTSVEIPDSVTSIGDGAFYGCTGLTSVEIPNSVTSIGRSAFSNCTGLTSVEIPNSVTSIGSEAFRNCTGLTSIEIPDSVTSIGSYAFRKCAGLTSVKIPDSVISIGEGAFYHCTGLTSVTVGTGVELIPENAFYNCSGLKGVVLPAEVLHIRDDAFSGCTAIETVFYEGSEAQWSEILFYNRNENLTDAKIIYNAVKKTYRFDTNCDAVLPDITNYAVFSSPSVKNEDLTLSGWYDNEELKGEPVTFPYYGDATTLYATWTDRTGGSYDDAFIVRANQEYPVTTTTSGQLVYFEFVPKYSKKYNFYTTGSKDTYGYLYNSSQSKLTYDDDDGDGNNFYISYDLTAGETYYIAAKIYSGTGSFTFVVEEPVDYRLNEITIKNMSGSSLQTIPTGTFLATVSLTNVSSGKDTVIVLAQYTNTGAFKGLMYIQTEDLPAGATIKLSIPVDNSDGDIAKLKAFCLESFGSLTPMGEDVSFPAE